MLTCRGYPTHASVRVYQPRLSFNAPVCELVTILGVNSFALHELKVKVCVLNTYMLLLRTLEVHLDPRLNGIPKRAMTEASGVKVGS